MNSLTLSSTDLNASQANLISLEPNKRFAKFSFSEKLSERAFSKIEQTVPSCAATALKVALTIPFFLVEKLAMVVQAFANAAIMVANSAYSAIFGDVEVLDVQPKNEPFSYEEPLITKDSDKVVSIDKALSSDDMAKADSVSVSNDSVVSADVSEDVESNDQTSVDAEDSDDDTLDDGFTELRLIDLDMDNPVAPEEAGYNKYLMAAAATVVTGIAVALGLYAAGYVNPFGGGNLEGDTDTVKPQEDTDTVKPQEDTNTVKPQEDTNTVKPQEDTNTAKPQEDTNTAKPQEDTNTAKPQEDTNTVKPQEVEECQGDECEFEEVEECQGDECEFEAETFIGEDSNFVE